MRGRSLQSSIHCIGYQRTRRGGKDQINLMGLLTLGHPLSWEETKTYIDYVKEHGIAQFIHLYNRLKGKDNDQLRWGDEIEYVILKLDHANKKVRVSLRGDELINRLIAQENLNKEIGSENSALWRPEYAGYMIEGTPGMPYGGLIACFNLVEMNMRKRRLEAAVLLKPDEIIMSIGNFMRLGCPDFTSPAMPLTPTDPMSVAKSLFFPDKAITQSHIRFSNLTRNIRHRRGENVAINVPIFKDEKTPSPFVEDLSVYGDDGSGQGAAEPDHIYMDAMGFGMGCCCLQVTFQAVNVKEARWLYDQLTPITPILLALSAATPVFRGYLADVDSRWDVIAASVDDRTREERGLDPLKENRFRIEKSRYDTTDCYLYACSEGYNDISLQYEQQHYDQLIAGGVDPLLAKHIAHLFIRDPLQVFKERIDQDDTKSSEHFETIQSSNWMNMRFKPPPPDAPEIGWRVEFRPTEVQLTDFENAAYVTFVVLLTRVIISFRLTFLVPISKVNENMARAQKRDAVLNEKFHFRMGLVTCNNPPMAKTSGESCKAAPVDSISEMSVDEIVNGKPDVFPGLVPLIKQYLDSADVDADTRCTVSQYLKFISKRAKGEIWTMAHWMRHYIRNHADYKQDSVVSDDITYDLITLMNRISTGEYHCEKLLGDFKSKSEAQIPSALRKAELNVAINNMKRAAKH